VAADKFSAEVRRPDYLSTARQSTRIGVETANAAAAIRAAPERKAVLRSPPASECTWKTATLGSEEVDEDQGDALLGIDALAEMGLDAMRWSGSRAKKRAFWEKACP